VAASVWEAFTWLKKVAQNSGMTDTKMYTVRLLDGTTVGPVDLQAVKKLLLSGQIAEEDRMLLVSDIFSSLSETPEILEQLAQPLGDAGEDVAPATFNSLDILQGIPPALVFVASEEKSASYHGQLENVSVARLLYFFHSRKATGRLQLLATEDEQRDVFFVNGAIQQIVVPSKFDDLYNRLLSSQLCRPEQLQQAAEACQRKGGHISDHLVAMQLMNPHDLLRVLYEQFCERLLDCFSLCEGPYLFYQNEAPGSSAVPHSIDLFPMIQKGIESHYEFSRLQWMLEPYYNKTVKKTDNPHIRFDELRLSPRQTRLVHMLDQPETLWSLVERAQSLGIADELAAHQFVYFLAQLELILFDNHTMGTRLQEHTNLLNK
jgi:hypothetical protein